MDHLPQHGFGIFQGWTIEDVPDGLPDFLALFSTAGISLGILGQMKLASLPGHGREHRSPWTYGYSKNFSGLSNPFLLANWFSSTSDTSICGTIVVDKERLLSPQYLRYRVKLRQVDVNEDSLKI